ncbi:MAG TPA: FAD-dependent oxidoreductase [Dehalococcoidales bacterium]|nr:FAD-dependent oxidoreductase [Dehalococcoidales bacterium]
MLTFRTGQLEKSPPKRLDTASIDRSLVPPCQAACPLHMSIREYIDLVAQGRIMEALQVIRDDNPFPSVCAFICNHACEDKCRRSQVDDPVSIRALKRFAVEFGGDRMVQLTAETTKKESIGVVGSGPAGLACAYYLRKLGYPVTVFEAQPEVGGMLRIGIPQYRLPPAVLDTEVRRLSSLGVEFKTNCRVNSLGNLFEQGFKAIFVTIGAQQSRRLGVPGDDLQGVVDAITFLREVNLGLKPVIGEKVVVVGGGNVAMDAARTALRLGARTVNLVCLESRPEMPAFKADIHEAVDEGVILNCSWGVKQLCGDKTVNEIQLKRCSAVFDAQKRFNPVYDESITTALPVDTVITAIGQSPQIPEDFHLRIGRGSTIQIDPVTLNTNQTGVFAGGDAVTGPSTVVQALATGRLAAIRIDDFIQRKYPRPAEEEIKSLIGELSAQTIEYIKKIHRHEPPVRDPQARIKEFQPVENVYNWEEAINEARRCLRCGAGAEVTFQDKCATCLTCLRDCPYKVPVLDSRGTLQISADQCQACGICTAQCPAKAISLRKPYFRRTIEDELEHIGRTKNANNLKPLIIGFCCQYGLFGTGILSALWRSTKAGIAFVPALCVASVEADHLLRAFEIGAEGVFIAGCGDECARQNTTFWVNDQIKRVQKVLKEVGLENNRLQFYAPQNKTENPADWLDGFANQIGSLYLNSLIKEETRRDSR